MQRANILYIFKILKEYSDEDNIISTNEIIKKLQQNYDITLDRRTIYSCITSLQEFGYDISDNKENHNRGYYLRERDLEDLEIDLLIDAIYSLPYISTSRTKELVEKLQKLQSKYKRRKIDQLTPIKNKSDKKTQNQMVFLNLELLNEAIKFKKQVSFQYYKYGLDKKLHLRRDKPYIVNPYGMVSINQKYHLICNLDGYPEISFYRIDMMKDIKILKTNSQMRDSEEVLRKVSNTTHNFPGDPQKIKIRCENGIVGHIIDAFGTDVLITEDGKDHFIARFEASPRGITYWALQFLPYAEVLEPKWVRYEIVEILANNVYTKSNK